MGTESTRELLGTMLLTLGVLDQTLGEATQARSLKGARAVIDEARRQLATAVEGVLSSASLPLALSHFPTALRRLWSRPILIPLRAGWD
jgi:hypothetical protein